MRDREYRAKAAKRVADAAAQRNKIAILSIDPIVPLPVPSYPAPNDPHIEGRSTGPERTRNISQPVKKNKTESARNRTLGVPNASPKEKANAKSRSMKKKI